jgi:hypothetical protein
MHPAARARKILCRRVDRAVFPCVMSVQTQTFALPWCVCNKSPESGSLSAQKKEIASGAG